MHILINVIHILSCFVLVIVVLLQAGKGANMGAAFGGASQTVFGSSGAGTFLGKMTTAVAVVFMLTSLFLSYTSIRKSSSLMEGASRPVAERPVTTPVPAPAQVPAQLPAKSAAPPVTAPQTQPAK
ncbi:MAG: Protein-export membrane protein SecG [Syntrophus sp. PtaU1.Bin208]|nr:MAG: Protein-export membrane protein SecG [Syntrophus sp. PtaU1.Bin208]